jgi:hypothetical protein
MERTSQYEALREGQQHLNHDCVPQLMLITDDWPVFCDAVYSLLGQLRSYQLFCPLSYLVRQRAKPTKADLAHTDYATLDDELIATVCHDGKYFKHNNSYLWSILEAKTRKGPAWSVISRYEHKNDGRKAFFALKRAAESVAPASGTATSKRSWESKVTKAIGNDDVITPETKKAKTAKAA